MSCNQQSRKKKNNPHRRIKKKKQLQREKCCNRAMLQSQNSDTEAEKQPYKPYKGCFKIHSNFCSHTVVTMYLANQMEPHCSSSYIYTVCMLMCQVFCHQRRLVGVRGQGSGSFAVLNQLALGLFQKCYCVTVLFILPSTCWYCAAPGPPG